MFKLILPMLLLLNLTIAQASDSKLDRADIDSEAVSEIVNLFTGESFDLADYRYHRELDTENGLYDLVSIEVNDQEDNAEYNVVVTFKRKWEFGIQSNVIDTKGLTRAEWNSRIYARDAERIQMGTARYRFNDIMSAGPAVLRSTNWVGQLPRSNDNPDHQVFVGGSIKIILK